MLKRKCQVCGQMNSSCNQYITRLGVGITICPSCLVWGTDEISSLARQAHREGGLIKPVKETKKGAKRK